MHHMKKVLLSVMTLAFALALQAGDGKACSDKAAAGCGDKKACSAEAKAQCGAEAKGQCPMAAQQAKAGCCPASKITVAKVDSPKGSEQVKR
jgi:hypothetical protein